MLANIRFFTSKRRLENDFVFIPLKITPVKEVRSLRAGAERAAQWLRALFVSGDLGLVPSTYVAAHDHL